MPISNFSNKSMTKQTSSLSWKGPRESRGWWEAWAWSRVWHWDTAEQNQTTLLSGRPGRRHEPTSRCRTGGQWGTQNCSLKILSFGSYSQRGYDPNHRWRTPSNCWGRGRDPRVSNPVNYCLWVQLGEWWWFRLLKEQPRPQDTQEKKRERSASSGSPGSPCADNLLRPQLQVTQWGFSLVSFVTPKLLVYCVGVISHSLHPCLCLLDCPARLFPSCLTSILLSAKWAEVCKAGWENPPWCFEMWPPSHTLHKEYGVRSKYSAYPRVVRSSSIIYNHGNNKNNNDGNYFSWVFLTATYPAQSIRYLIFCNVALWGRYYLSAFSS